MPERKNWINFVVGAVIAYLGYYIFPTNNLFGVLIAIAGIAILLDSLGIFE